MRRREVWASIQRCYKYALRCEELAEEFGRRAELETNGRKWTQLVTSGAECREMASAFRQERDRLYKVAYGYKPYKHNQS